MTPGSAPIPAGNDARGRGDDPGDAARAGRVAPPGQGRDGVAAGTGLDHDAGEYRPADPAARHHRARAAAGTPRPLYGTLALPVEEDGEGPPDGLTLDQAIERLVRENLDLRSKSMEIPQAQADILTASLRANPILYADSQLIPYGNYSNRRPGGPTQYDVNISHPLDYTHKRRARIEVATPGQA